MPQQTSEPRTPQQTSEPRTPQQTSEPRTPQQSNSTVFRQRTKQVPISTRYELQMFVADYRNSTFSAEANKS